MYYEVLPLQNRGLSPRAIVMSIIHPHFFKVNITTLTLPTSALFERERERVNTAFAHTDNSHSPSPLLASTLKFPHYFYHNLALFYPFLHPISKYNAKYNATELNLVTPFYRVKS